MNLHIIILAAGQGTRMCSAQPKVLHPLAGRPLLAHVLATASALDPQFIHLVYGHGGDQVRAAFSDDRVEWVEQSEQLGTGHAVLQAMPGIPDEAVVLVLYGDVPLIRRTTLQPLIDLAAQGRLALLTTELDDATGYGRICRDQQQAITGIVEHKDADAEQLAIQEINTGFLACPAGLLRGWLAGLENHNSQGEYYLTDIVERACADGISVEAVGPEQPAEVLGVNDRRQLATLERVYQGWQADRLMAAGVTLLDPARIDVRGDLRVERDITIDVNCIFEGEVSLGEGVHIGPNCTLKNVVLEAGVTLLANSVLEDARVGRGSRVGPFARLRPETVLAANTHIGNFVEIKKSSIGEGSKVNHLSYIGDTEMGSEVNIGAGTITCNYDGAYKHKTTIGDRVFVGSDCQLIAPVEIKPGATLGAGTTLTREAPADQLTLSRAKQITIEGWKRPVKRK